ncbi:hypothetical protein NK718_02575 [Alsobacter sp. SYSU M60028]|uniref:Transcriptional regulator n=1 Tax=Alsobacter ponti TaxID=2962936 RepID=A0ABT1L7I5_9HYPH|nr:hypothetical protein [Alsobacter ponti]MCP8937387.1 hypothetical protein [Alsobacter ponti]
MSSTGTEAQRSARRKASAFFDKSAQRQLEADRRVEAQRVAERQFAAKTERLRSLRLERDELLVREAAERRAAETTSAGPKKKSTPG